jgi:hypothetical protein
VTNYLQGLVLQKIAELGDSASAEFFGVGEQLIRQWANGSKPMSLTAVEKVFDPEVISKSFSHFETSVCPGQKVAVLLPFYKNTNPRTAVCLFSLIDRAKVAVMTGFGDAFIVHTRNTLGNRFVQSGLEWSVWFDDDMVIPYGNAGWFNKATGFNFPDKFAGIHAINQLMSRGKTLIGGLYFGRHEMSGRPMYSGGNDPIEAAQAHNAPNDIVKPVNWVATGCLLAHRSVYLDIQKTFPTLAPQCKDDDGKWHFFSNSETDLTKAAVNAMAILSDEKASESARISSAMQILGHGHRAALANGRLKQGEDVTFCKRALESGHQPFVDFSVVCGHLGEFCFGPTGRFGRRQTFK